MLIGESAKMHFEGLFPFGGAFCFSGIFAAFGFSKRRVIFAEIIFFAE